MPFVSVSAKGSITIPAEYRRQYNIRPGDRLAIVDYARRLSFTLVRGDPIESGRGLLAGGPSLTRALLRERRDERRRENRKCARFRSGHHKASR